MESLDFLEKMKIGFIGGGNMAQAIGLGLIKKNILNPSNLWVSSRTETTLNIWKKFHVNTSLNNYDIIKNSNIIFIAVKPYNLQIALETCKPPSSAIQRFKGKLYISVLVGTSLNVLKSVLENIDDNPKIVRSMPNTPMMLSEGITVYCSLNTNDEDEKIVRLLFSQLGICETIPESLMNSTGGLCGSGPAYAYLIVEALADGAVFKGVPRALATKLAAQVLVGAGKMVLETGKHPGQLKDEVCSPGGSTIAGVHAMECGNVRASMMNAVIAAADRSDELSKIAK